MNSKNGHKLIGSDIIFKNHDQLIISQIFALVIIKNIKITCIFVHRKKATTKLNRVHLNMINVHSPVTTILSNGPRGFIIIISEIVEFLELVRKEQKKVT